MTFYLDIIPGVVGALIAGALAWLGLRQLAYAEDGTLTRRGHGIALLVAISTLAGIGVILSTERAKQQQEAASTAIGEDVERLRESAADAAQELVNANDRRDAGHAPSPL